MDAPPDLVVTGARLHRAAGDAVAISAGRITRVGEARTLLRARGPRTRVVEVPGGLVCPGFHDAHAHLVLTAAARREIDLHGLDAAGVVAAVRERADADPQATWIVGRGYEPSRFPGAGSSARALLDAAAPRARVVLRSHDYHTVALNTAALRATGFLPAPPDPPGGRVGRDAAGEPDGVLHEFAARDAEARVDDGSEDALAAATCDVVRELFAAGITALHDMSASRHLRVLEVLDAAGALALPVFATLAPEHVEAATARAPGRRLRVLGMKAFLDGALGSRTAHLLAPYEGDACCRGVATLTPQAARDHVLRAARAGLPSCLHAIGDAAVRTALDVLAGVRAPDGRALRHRVEHAQLVDDADLPRFAREGVVASAQPVHLLEDAPLARSAWGARTRSAFPLRRLADAGTRIALGSDSPIESFDVLLGLRAAVERTARDGSVLHGDEALTPAEALDGYTSGAAWAAGADHEHGALRRGLRGSLSVLSADVVAHPAALRDAVVALTVVEGDVVFEREAA